MGRVVDFPMSPKLGLDVLVAEKPHIGREMLAVGAKEATVQVDRRQKSNRVGSETAARGGHGQPQSRWAHIRQCRCAE